MDLLVFFLVILLAYTNGANDVSKSIATLVGSGVTNYRTALAWGTIWTILGAGASTFVAGSLIRTFSQDFIRAQEVPFVMAPAVLLAAMAWVLFASRTGLPVSTTHALTGGLMGVGWMAYGTGGLVWETLTAKVALPLLLSPLWAFMTILVLHRCIRLLATRWDGACLCLMPASRALVAIDGTGATRTLFQAGGVGSPVVDVPSHCDLAGLRGIILGLDSLHWISSGLAAFARGTNDAPKILAMLVLGGTTTWWPGNEAFAYAAVAIAMGIGSYAGGRRVTETLAERVTQLSHAEGLSANLTTSSLVLLSGMLGWPVSTTHVSSSSIIGIGLMKSTAAVRWDTVRDMAMAWIVTLPLAAVLSAVAYHALTMLL